MALKMSNPSTDHDAQSPVAAHSDNPKTTLRCRSAPNSFYIGTPTIILTNPSPDTDWKNYKLQKFLTVDPVEDANVLYARIAVKRGHVYPGFVPNLPEYLANEPLLVDEFPTLQARDLNTQPYTDRWATQQMLERAHYPNPKCSVSVQPQPQPQRAANPWLQITGTSPMRMDTLKSASTPTLRLPEQEDLGFSLRSFLAADPADDANALYGRITLMDDPNTLGDHCPLARTFELGEEEEEGCQGYKISRATTLQRFSLAVSIQGIETDTSLARLEVFTSKENVGV